ncbi:hypothetical protein GCM10025783_02380 [Amnibacterium soli]|uniref:Uncharacterized protein n=1 Tax=Amnibacterium soli TaxID=1282736 RepID=A0ABP8YTC0_9MICO
MGLSASLALLRVHVLVVELPGRPLLRLRAEAALRARGWVVVTDPEDADLVLVCGAPHPEVAAAVDALWARVPLPRARRTVRAEADLADVLDSAARVIGDDALQREAAAAAVAGVRPVPDGRYGPVRAHWPAGLIIDCALDDGGRIAAAGVRRLSAEQEEDPDGLRPFVLPVADAARLLRLVGWPALALRLDRVLDLAVGGTAPERLRGRLRSVERTVRRSETLRWLLRREGHGVAVAPRLLALLRAAAVGEEPPRPAARRLLGRDAAAVPILVAVTEEVLPRA